MAIFSTHLLNSIDGTHASDVEIVIHKVNNNNKVVFLEDKTDSSGRMLKEFELTKEDCESDYEMIINSGKYFRNTIQEFHLGLDFNFLEFETSSNNFEYTPYIHTGLSLIRFDALHYPIGINEAQAYGKDNDLALPMTVGIKIKPLNSFVVGLEISAKHRFTENLDGSYPEFDDSSLYSQRPFGSNLSQDWYVYSGITLTYLFGNYECDCTR